VKGIPCEDLQPVLQDLSSSSLGQRNLSRKSWFPPLNHPFLTDKKSNNETSMTQFSDENLSVTAGAATAGGVSY